MSGCGMTQWAWLFLCALARLMPLALLWPGTAARVVSLRIRIALSLVLALWIASLFADSSSRLPGRLPDAGVVIGYELLLGLGLALGLQVLLVGVQLAGSLVSQLAGLSWSDLGDPAVAWGATSMDRFLAWLTLAALLAMQGHRRVIAALLTCFQAVPPGTRPPAVDVAPLLAELLTRSFQVGFRLAAPIGFALLLAMLVMALLARSIPQLNSIGLGLSINLAVLLVMACLSLGAVAWLFEQHLIDGLHVLTQSLRPSAGQG